MSNKEKEMTKPTKFEDLKPTELYRSALEDFAVPVDEADKNKKTVLLAALLESGVTWADYVAQHPEVAPDEPVDEKPHDKEEEPMQEEVVVVKGAQKPKPQVSEKYLVKMMRENVRFDIRGHKFTAEHPYALVDEDDANFILEHEDGFRLASPAEVSEFYG